MVETNKEQKHALGKSANATANKYLANLRGMGVIVTYHGEEIERGVLEEFDLYALIVDGALVFKGPGIVVRGFDGRDGRPEQPSWLKPG